MQLKSAWNAVSAAANKSTGKDDIDLGEHLSITGQAHLPQAEALLECLELLKQKGLLEEAYLRGSFGRGHGDIHSDVDLFTVVLPENLEAVYDTVRAYLAEKGGIITDCHDRLVADYGGIGFMFVANNEAHKQVYQFDLYMAIKGVAPLQDFFIKPRIYSRDPDYRWMKEYGTPRDMDALPAATKSFMQKHMKGQNTADRVELLMQELLLTIFVAHKHIKRGQVSRTIVDNNALVASAIEMLQAVTGYTANGYSSVYLGDEIVKFCRQNGDDEMIAAADRLEKFFTQKISRQKLRDILAYAGDILQQAFPEHHERQKDAIAFFEKTILTSAPKKPPAQPGPAK